MSGGFLPRRDLLGAGGALVVSFGLGRPAHADEQGGSPPAKSPAPLPGSLKETPELDAWIRVAADGGMEVFTGKAELGQGLKTALLQVAAEQLDVAPSSLRLITADTGRTPNEGFTAGSHSMQDSGTAILHAARQVRGLLVEAAASRFGLPSEVLQTRDGAVHAPDGRRASYGELAASLSLHVPAQPGGPLKDPGAYQVIGAALPRVDIPAKVTGGSAYIQDLRLPGMLHARAVRQPSPGAMLRAFDAAPIERMPGVVAVVRQGSFLAVVAGREWQAVQAWHALSAAAEWEETATLPDEAGIAGGSRLALTRALDRKDAAAVAEHGGALARLLTELLLVAGPVAPALEMLEAARLPPLAAALCARLHQTVQAILHQAPDVRLTLDPIEFRGLRYHTGVCVTVFAPGRREELGRGGRYVSGDGEPAGGLTLYPDAMLRALPPRASRRRAFLPWNTPREQGAALRNDGYATLSALADGPDPAGEARRLGCTHILRDGAVVPLTPES